MTDVPTDNPSGDPSDDPELRSLLDSLGITSDGPGVAPSSRDEDIERAEMTLARIVAQPKDRPTAVAPRTDKRRRTPAPSWARRRRTSLAAAALAVVLAVVVWIVFTPGTTDRQTAFAQTPAMLHFSQVRSHEVPTTGAPAADQLRLLAEKVQGAPRTPSAALPVQHLEIEAWYSSTEPAKAGAPPKSVLIPTHRDSYLFPNGDLRAIERRGTPLDADGKVSKVAGGWNHQPLLSDETINISSSRPANYPDKLPLSLNRLGKVLAPPADCAPTRGGCLLSAVTDLYSNFVIDPDLSTALWRLLAAEPSITYLGTTTDRLDRPALAFSAASLTKGQQIIVLVDGATGQYLGYETILVKPSPDLGFVPPAVLEFSSLVQAQRIATTGVPNKNTTTRR